MQADGALQGVSTIPRRRRLSVVAIVVFAAMVVALVVWTAPFATSGGVGAEDAIPKTGAGSAIVHDDAGNMPLGAGSAVIHDDAGNLHAK
jgi:ferric-dicitrate binding protein FerR (iron transport regulator)